VAGQHPVNSEGLPLPPHRAVRLAHDLFFLCETDTVRPQHPHVLPAVQSNVEDNHRATVPHRVGNEDSGIEREAGERIGVSDNTLLIEIRNGALVAHKIGKQWVVTAEDLKVYDEKRKEPRGFARPDHPLHGKRGGGGRPKKPND
jgi:hypothetical protein